jgi:glycogen operon protein
MRGEVNERGLHDVEWHGCNLACPGFDDPSSGVLAMTIGNMVGSGPDLHILLNMEDQALDFEVPPMIGRTWHRLVDTSQPSPADFCDPGDEVPVAGTSITAAARSVVVLISK